MKRLLKCAVGVCLAWGIATPFARGALVPTTNLQLWLDAGDVNADNVPDVVAGGTPLSNWADKSGQNHNATQGSGPSQPIIETNQINGQRTLRFDGVSAYMTTSGYRPSLSSQYTVFIVEQFATLNDGGYLSSANGQTGADGDLIRLRNNGGSPEVRIFSGGGFHDFTGMHGVNTPGILTFTNNAVSGGGAGTQIGYLDGTQIGSSSLSRSAVNTTGQDLLVGANGLPGTGAPTYNGDIAEILIYDTVLSPDNTNQVGYYLQSKYGISGAFVAPEPFTFALPVLGGLYAFTRRRK